MVGPGVAFSVYKSDNQVKNSKQMEKNPYQTHAEKKETLVSRI